MKKALELKRVRKKYGELVALENLSLSMEEGEFLCMVGTSGSGKTTLMKMVNGLIEPDEGKVCIY